MNTNQKIRSATLALWCLLGASNVISAAVKSDFNGDGWGDQAIGAPQDDVNGHGGAVNVLYGSVNGLSASGNSLLSPTGNNGCLGASHLAEFGHALAVGDFNKDGFGDLAVGAPDDNVGSVIFAGRVYIFYGSPNGLSCAKAASWSQNSIPGSTAEQDDWFGSALAAGDFNGDSYSDLAIGAWGDSVPNDGVIGSVTIMYGSSSGINTPWAQVWTLNSPGVPGNAVPGEGFGYALATGQFGKGSQADLAIGIPYKQMGTAYGAGAITVLYGSNNGLTANGSQFWSQDTPGVSGAAESGDEFGWALAAGNFGKSGEDDLAISANNENQLTGLVHILYGTNNGLSAAGNQIWSGSGKDQRYGEALAAADFGHGSYADLAIGAPRWNLGSWMNAGRVQVLYGTSTGLSSANSQFLTMGFGAAPNDYFGAALGVANFGKSSQSDLTVGLPGEDG